jgi:cell division transport system permease protein
LPAPRPNQLYVIISLALVLFLLGLVGLWTFQANYLTKQLQESLDIIVELEEGHTEAQRTELITGITTADFNKPGSRPGFISKQAALEAMGDDLQRDLNDLGLNNPLLDVVTFNVPIAYLQTDSLAAIAANLQAKPGVASVFYQENFVDRIADNARRMGYVLLAC